MRSTTSLTLLGAAALAAACQAPSRDAASSGNASSGESAASRPAARPAPVVIPEGTRLPVVLETSLSSDGNNAGDTVVGKLSSDVTVEGRTLAAAGSELRGRVTAAVGSGRVKGRARLAFAFDTLEVHGRRHEINATPIDITAEGTGKKDAAIIGGSAVAGGIIGAIADGKGGAGKGVLIGGAAGTGAVLATKGKEVRLPAGTQLELKLNEPARLER
jgi:hypothetical protein